MTLREQIELDRDILESIRDISLYPNIKIKRLERARKAYGLGNSLDVQKVLLMVDNTILGSGKQGLIVTEQELHAFTNICGRFSIRLDDIYSLSPQVRKASFGATIPGIVINNGYFASLPGMVQTVRLGNYEQSSVVALCLLLKNRIRCEIEMEPEEDPGPPPWYLE